MSALFVTAAVTDIFGITNAFFSTFTLKSATSKTLLFLEPKTDSNTRKKKIENMISFIIFSTIMIAVEEKC